MIKNIIFDLDGTISKSGEGILNSFAYSLKKMGKSYDYESLKKYIGPPLRDSFVKEVGEERADRAVEIYRSYYAKKGVYEASAYEGICELLKNLYENNYRIYLATSKIKKPSLEVLKYFDLLKYFTYVEGSNELLDNKSKVIQSVIDKNKLRKDESIMIGDRSYDIESGFALGLKTIGVSYGYGDISEFKRADYIAHSPQEIGEIIKKIN